MNLNYNYVQDLGGEKLRCWFTPRVEIKTHSYLPGTLNPEMQEQPVILQLPSVTEAFLLGGRERHATLQKNRQKNQMHISEWCCILHHLWHDLKEHSDCSGQEHAVCLWSNPDIFILGGRFLKQITDQVGRCTNEVSENTVVIVFGKPQWS